MRINSISTQKLPGTVNWAVSESFFLLIRIFLICRFALHPAGAAPLRACRRGIALFIFAVNTCSYSRLPAGVAARPPSAVSFNAAGHRVAYALHREDRFIGGDRAANASQRELRRNKSARYACRIAVDAGNFHKTGHRVTHKAQYIAQRDGHRVASISGAPPHNSTSAAAAMAAALPHSA